MKILGIIPARGGSKGLKNKNILNLNKKPLIAWSILCAKKSKIFDKLIVSTDSNKIAKISKKIGAEIPFLRPKSISHDKSKSSELIIHAINFYKKKNIFFDYVFLLEPTSPLREVKDIKYCFNLIKKTNINSLVSVSKLKSQHPNFLYKLKKQNKIRSYLKSKKKETRRQDVEDLYFLDGTIYCSKVKTFLKNKSFYHQDTCAIDIPSWKSIEIDDYDDFKTAEFLMKLKITK